MMLIYMDYQHATNIQQMFLFMASEALFLSACPDHNQWFDIYIDSSNYQVGTCSQSVDYYIKKVDSAQKLNLQLKKKCY